MRVLWISPGFAAHENDTSCIPPLQLLALELKTMGIDLEIITMAYPQTPDPYTWNSISVKSSYGSNSNFLRWLNWIRAYRNGLRLNKEKKIDILHSFWLGPAWLIGNQLSKKCKLPHINTLMGQDVLKSNKYTRLIKSEDTKNIVAVSQIQASTFYKTCNLRPSAIIEWGIDPAHMDLKVNAKRPIDVIGCGSLIKLKNWDLWIDTVAGIISHDKTINAVIIGDGPEKSKILSRIHSLGIEDNIKIFDTMPRNEVLQLMGKAKILLHTSSFESYGLVLSEAYAMGCFVISTPVGIAEKLGPTGISIEELQNLIVGALNQKIIRLSTEIPTISNTAIQYLELYNMKIDLFKNKSPF